jgi:hypothetical protein
MIISGRLDSNLGKLAVIVVNPKEILANVHPNRQNQKRTDSHQRRQRSAINRPTRGSHSPRAAQALSQ